MMVGPPAKRDPTNGLSQAHLLMAASLIDVTGAIARQSDLNAVKAIGRMANPERFRDAVSTMPQSTNIEDRRDENENTKTFEAFKNGR